MTSNLADVRALWLKLPKELEAEAHGVVLRHANAAASEARASYPRVSGKLAAGVKVIDRTGPERAAANVVNTTFYALPFEYGSQVRTFKGASRGAVRPQHVFMPIMDRHRRAMVSDIIARIEARGAKVSGR